MGILDEAIREHLELKRQHGAADSELRELEDEAFGPPARPGEPAVGEAAGATEATAVEEAEAPAELAEASAGDTGVPAEEEHPAAEHDVPGAEEAEAAIVAVETEEHPPPAPPEPDPAAEAEETSISDQPTEIYEDAAPEAEPAPEEPGAEPEAPPSDGEPLEDEFFSEQSLSDELDQALDAPEGEGDEAQEPDAQEQEPEQVSDAPEGEDVLEETPEFLQDTPEHDRLWFEQKPPKDFDFDD